MIGDKIYRKNVEVVILKRFVDPVRANICASHLKAAEIPCFISNQATSQLIPFSEGGITLHVRKKDIQEATQIVREVEKNEIHPPEQDFREADLEDIRFEQRIYLHEKRMEQTIWKYVGLALLLLIIAMSVVFTTKAFIDLRKSNGFHYHLGLQNS